MQGGRLVWLSAEVAAKHLSSRAFLASARRESAAAAAAAAAGEGEGEDEDDDEAKDVEEERELEAEAAAALVAARLQEGYASLAECALTLLQAGAAAGAESASPSPGGKGLKSKKSAAVAAAAAAATSLPLVAPGDVKSASRMERGGRQVLSALDGLLAPGPYLRALAPLLAHSDGRVRRKALRLIAHRLHVAGAAVANSGNKFGKKKGE